MVGNEHTGGRPWHGRVLDMALLDRAISPAEISDLVAGRRGLDSADSSLLASYDLRQPCPCPDGVGYSPSLEVRTLRWRFGREREHGAVSTTDWLETRGPVTEAVERIRRASAFTLAATIAASGADERGPARIVSLSIDRAHRNLTLGQEGSDLVVRLRTPLTGPRGDRPALVAHGVLAGAAVRHLVVTYDGRDLSAYVDGDRAGGVRFGLGVAALAPFLGRDARAFPAYELVYYALVFVPAGMLVSRAAAGHRRLTRGAVAIAGVAVLAMTLELVLVAVSHRPPAASGVLWSLLSGAAGAAVLLRSPLPVWKVP
jgi:hypothetical protein